MLLSETGLTPEQMRALEAMRRCNGLMREFGSWAEHWQGKVRRYQRGTIGKLVTLDLARYVPPNPLVGETGDRVECTTKGHELAKAYFA